MLLIPIYVSQSSTGQVMSSSFRPNTCNLEKNNFSSQKTWQKLLNLATYKQIQQ